MMFQTIKTSLVSAILITVALIAQAQKKINEGIIVYGVEHPLLSAEQKKAGMPPLPEEFKLIFNGNITKMEIDQGYSHVQIITDQNAKNATVLIDVSIAQKQLAYKTTKADYDKTREGAPKFSDFIATGEKQTIAGYNATKYTYKDDKGATYEAWATTDIEIPIPVDDPFKDIKGALLKYTIFQNGTLITLIVKSITEAKVGALSLEIPNGYELISKSEMDEMRNRH